MTQKKELKEKIKLLEEELKVVTEDRDRQKGYYDTWYKKSSELEKEINSVHAVFDSLSGVIDRYVEVQGQWGSDKVEMGIVSRFASYQQTLITK